jgi:hypothetical protein
MHEAEVEYPLVEDATLVKRVARLPADARSWRGNGSRLQCDHHELVNPGSGPLHLHLEWTDENNGEVAVVGDYWINLRTLAKRGYVQEKGKQVRLRFVRWKNGTVVIQANDSSPWLGVGTANFHE